MAEHTSDTGRSSSLPSDGFSIAFRQLSDNPGAVRASSKVDLIDFYGRTESWIIDTFREDGNETVFLQRMSAEGALRLVLPSEVTATISRQHDRATTVNRKRGARQALATRIARGDRIGNPEALHKARKAKRAARKAGRA